jgi:hypothetical protein
MKKLLMAVALVGLIGFAGIQMASAHGGYSQGGGNGYCGDYSDGDNTKDTAALEKFHSETTDIRKGIIVKRNELRALMNQDNPDEKRVAQLTGEVFDLENALNKKAADKGITGRSNYGHGPGMMRGNGYRNGRHMMDW